MPTCRRCGRVGHHVCPKVRPSPSPGKATPATPWRHAKQGVRDQLHDLADDLGDLLRAEEHLGRGDPSLDERDRHTHVSHVRTQLMSQLKSLQSDVRKSVVGEACWRRTGVRPGYFSEIGMVAPAKSISEATQTDAIKSEPLTHPTLAAPAANRAHAHQAVSRQAA